MTGSSEVDLTKFSLFSTLDSKELKRFDSAIEHKDFHSGEVIIMEGEVGDSIFLLEKGEVEITQAITLHTNESSFDTREKSIIRLNATSFPFFGEMSLFGEKTRRTATVTAISNCRMGIISKKTLFEICESDPLIGYKVMKNIAYVLSSRLTQCNQNVLKLTTAFSLILEK